MNRRLHPHPHSSAFLDKYRLLVLAGLLFSLCAGLFLHSFSRAAVRPPQGSVSSDGVWQDFERSAAFSSSRNAGRAVHLNRAALQAILDRAPREAKAIASQTALTLPLPGGAFARFHIEESSIMESALATQFPEIKSYRGQGIDDPAASVRFAWSPRGLHAYVLAGAESFTIHPANGDETENYLSLRDDDLRVHAAQLQCHVPGGSAVEMLAPNAPRTALGAVLRTYRIAVATTQEYTNNAQLGGGTVGNTIASINAWLNGVNAIYEKELAVRLNLAANNNLAVFTAEPDGFTNGNVGTLLNEVPGVLATRLGASSYDVGHVLGTSVQGGQNGGVALIGVTCNSANGSAPAKGGGASAMSAPLGNSGGIGLLAHEFGHQFGANHTFNGTVGVCNNQRSSNTAWEPGSGVTIMSYGGLCIDQNNNTDNIQGAENRFHNGSFSEIANFIAGAGGGCAVQTQTGNSPPTINGGADFTIPKNTPFTLTATGTDPDPSDIPNLTYVWEQLDAGGTFSQNGTIASYTGVNDAANNTRPLFRSFTPSANLARIFPSLNIILNSANVPNPQLFNSGGENFWVAENLPSVARTLNFRITARDNRGGVSDDAVTLTVADVGPLAVTAPNTAVTWTVGSQQTVTWNVNGANTLAANVRILLSLDGGQNFPFTLADSTPNDGSHVVTVPNALNTSTARVRVAALGNIFFDVSDANFMINAGGNCPFVSSLTPGAGTVNSLVTINGTGLSSVTSVVFGGNVTATLNNVSDTQIVLTVPSGAVTGTLMLVKPGCPNVQTGNFIVCASSATAQLDDNSFEVGDALFAAQGGTSYFIHRLTPASYPATLSAVQVQFPSGEGIAANTPLTILSGANLSGGADINSVSFQTVNATVGALNQFNEFGVAALTINSGDFVVGFAISNSASIGFPVLRDTTTPRGRSYTSGTDTSNFITINNGNYAIRARYQTGCVGGLTCPTVSDINPTSAQVSGQVTITGSGLSGVNAVRFGSLNALFTLVNDNQLTATVPNGAVNGPLTLSKPNCADVQTGQFVVCPTIASLTPTSGAPGAGVTITGTGFTGVTAVRFSNNINAQFTVNSDTQIIATVPANAVTGPIIISKPGCPDVQTSNFTVNAAPPNCQTITGINPAQAAVGAPVTITGTNFADVNAVKFSNNVNAQFTINNSTQITVTVPGGAVSGPITLSKASCPDAQTASFAVCPTVAGLSATSAQVGATLTINGSGFTGVSAVRFNNNVTAQFTIVNDATITTTAPSGAVNGAITLSKPNCPDVLTGSFTVCPTVTSFMPALAQVGAQVTINGTGFTGLSTVKFSNNVTAQFTVVSDAQITTTVPSGAVNGLITLSKINCPDVTTANFIVCHNVTGLSPTVAQVGAQVTISGAGFTGVNAVRFGNNVTAQFTIFNDTTITATVPAGALNGAITLSKDNCPNAQTASFTVCPTVANLTPASGQTGAQVTLTGTGFTGVTAIKFSNNVTAQFTINNDTQITATVPAGAVTGPLTVSKPGCNDVLTANFTVTSAPPNCPAVTGVTPAAASVGAAVTLTGTGFTGVNAVRFNINVSAQFSVVNDTQITATVPNGAVTGLITLSKPNCPNAQTAVFTVCPSVSGLAPTSGQIGAAVTISGSGFTGLAAVRFGNNTTAQFNVVSDTQLTTAVPAGALSGPITLSKPNCPDVQTASFTICPTVVSLNPNSGQPSAIITLNGAGFTGVTSVKFTNNVNAQFTIVSDTQLTTTVPVGAASGPITLSKPNCPDAQTPNFTFTPPNCPVVSSLAPTSGQVGAVITINGAGFTGVNAVRFSNNVAAQFTVVSDVQLTATVPSGAVGGPITLSKLNCPDVQTAVFTVTQQPACLTISSFAPAVGQAGATVTLTGTGFTGVNAVRFSDNANAQFTVVSDTQITALVPADAVNGPIKLSKPNCADTQTASFTVCPTVASISPVSGQASSIVTITGTGFLGVNAVRFSNNINAAFTVVSNTQITATAPSGVLNGPLTLSKPNCPDVLTPSFSLCPAVTSISPLFGAPGAPLMITGSGFTGVVVVRFGNNAQATFTVVTDALIMTTVPANAQTGPITIGKPDCPDVQTPSFTVNANCGFTVTASANNFAGAGGNGVVNVTTTNPACVWTAVSNASWLTITAAGSGVGNGTINFTVAVNNGPPRTGTLLIAEQTITITQEANCVFTLSPASQNFSADSGTGTVTLTTANSICTRTAGSNVSWLTITAGASGTGNGAVNYAVAANTSFARTGTLTIAGQTFTVMQEAGNTRIANVSAASFSGNTLTPEGIVAAFGMDLATSTQFVRTQPLPTTLAGTSVRIRDNANVERLAPLFFVSPTQVNYLLPAGVAFGLATVTITSSNGNVATGTIIIARSAPAFFTFNANGRGVPAGVVLRVRANGTQVTEQLARFDTGQNSWVPVPVDLGPTNEQVFLIVFGAGIRNRNTAVPVTARLGGVTADVTFAGAQGTLAGLDQVNIRVPRSLVGRGEVDLVVTVDGLTANTVRVNIR